MYSCQIKTKDLISQLYLTLNLWQGGSERKLRQSYKLPAWALKANIKTNTVLFCWDWETYQLKAFKEISFKLLAENESNQAGHSVATQHKDYRPYLVQERPKTNSKKNNKKQQSAITQTLGEEVICITGSHIILSKMCKF